MIPWYSTKFPRLPHFFAISLLVVPTPFSKATRALCESAPGVHPDLTDTLGWQVVRGTCQRHHRSANIKNTTNTQGMGGMVLFSLGQHKIWGSTFINKHQEDTCCLVIHDIASVSVLVGALVEGKACKSLTGDFQSLRALRISRRTAEKMFRKRAKWRHIAQHGHVCSIT